MYGVRLKPRALVRLAYDYGDGLTIANNGDVAVELYLVYTGENGVSGLPADDRCHVLAAGTPVAPGEGVMFTCAADGEECLEEDTFDRDESVEIWGLTRAATAGVVVICANAEVEKSGDAACPSGA